MRPIPVAVCIAAVITRAAPDSTFPAGYVNPVIAGGVGGDGDAPPPSHHPT